jgi:hypothetical protein
MANMLRIAFIELPDDLVHEVERCAPDNWTWSDVIASALRYALDEGAAERLEGEAQAS